MPIQFACPHCGAQTDVAEEYAGQSGPCAACGEPITVPPFAGMPGEFAPAKSSQTPIVVIVVILAVVAIGGLLVCAGALFWVRTSSQVGPGAQPASCSNNLEQIGMAMHNYHAVYKCFPPAYIPDENGEPKHSWRVLLLPYLGHEWLHDQYDFDEPWDSPNNLALAKMMPDVYRCGSDSAGGSKTGYVVIVGPGTVFDGAKTTSLDEISASGGAPNTILVLEVGGTRNWLEPRDYDYSLQDGGLPASRGSQGAIERNHPGVVNVLFCDGSVRSISSPMSRRILRDAATVAGGEDAGGLPEVD